MKYSNNNAEEGKKREKNTKESAAVLLLSVESQRELKEIELLRAHILSYRTSTSSTSAPTSSSSRAVKCTIAALDMERDRIMRDEKLKRKFAGKQQEEEEAVATAGGDVVMVDGHKSSREVDPTIRASLEILESAEVTTSSNAHCRIMDTTTHTAEDEDDEWQEIMNKDQVDNPPGEDQPMDGSDIDQQHLGTLLAQISISSLSEGNVRVSNPLSLIAVAIHAVLRSNILAFQCTGIPPNTTAKVSGFAAPIRELPKTVYLPKDWDSSSISYDPTTTTTHSLGNIVLRYRKKDVDGPMVLSVSLLPRTLETEDDNNYGSPTLTYDTRNDLTYSSLAQYLSDSKNNTIRIFLWERMPYEQLEKLLVQVKFGPSSTSSDDISTNITFPLGRHVNVLSLGAAIASSQQQQAQLQTYVASVPPMLHYKSLSTLLVTFVRSFDVGNVYDSTIASTAAAPKDAEQATVKTRTMESNNSVKQSYDQRLKSYYGVQNSVTRDEEYYYHKPEGSKVESLIGDDLLRIPGRQQERGGDFAGDLLFTPTDPLMNPNLPLPRPTGNLMGPNHPLFHLQEQYDNDDDIIGGHRMRPRFDPYGPPGGPTDPTFVDPTFQGRGRANRGRGAGRGGSGDPNPDHLRPPRDFFS